MLTRGADNAVKELDRKRNRLIYSAMEPLAGGQGPVEWHGFKTLGKKGYKAPLDQTIWTEVEAGAPKSDYNDAIDGLANLARYLVTNHNLSEWPLRWFRLSIAEIDTARPTSPTAGQ